MTDVLYGELAHLYDLIYTEKDYSKEVVRLLALIDGEAPSRTGAELLDIGCGTGNHIQLLAERFQCTGLDLCEEMLSVARGKVPEASFVQGDMRSFDLGREFDVVTSLFGTIGYALDLEGLETTLACMAKHLRASGVLVIDPWYAPDKWIEGFVNLTTHDEKDLKIARVGSSTRRGLTSVLELHYLVARKGEGVRHLVDVHEMGLFEGDEVLGAMDRVGLDGRFSSEGFADDDRGTYIAVKPMG